MRSFSPGRIAALCVSSAAALFAVANANAQGILIPLPARHDMVFDHAGRYLYITTSDGWVRPYNLSTSQLETGYYLGGSLNGLDIATDDSFLLIAQDDWSTPNGIFHKLDLATGAVADITYPREFGEGGGWDVAIASNGLALVTTAFLGSGWVPLRQIDLATNAITIRSDVPTYFGNVRGDSRLNRNPTGTRLVLSEITAFPGLECFTYTAANNSFSAVGPVGSERTALNKEGTLLATGLHNSVSLDTVADYTFVHAFSSLGSGIAFDAVADILYAASTFSDEIIAYDSGTFVEKFRLDVGDDVAPFPHEFDGALVASHDGHHIALATGPGIRLFEVPPNSGPAPPALDLPMDMVFDHAGQRLYIATLLGWVWPYNLATSALETPFNPGGSLSGLDIAPDDSFLVVTQYYRGIRQGMFQKIDLHTRQVTNINYDLTTTEQGSWDVAIGPGGRAIVTTHVGANSGSTLLREIDLANSNAISPRYDAPGGGSVRMETQIQRSADRSRFFFLEPNSSVGPIFTYNAVTNSFGPGRNTDDSLSDTSAAVNRNGTLLARRTLLDTFVQTAPDFADVTTVTSIRSGVAFDAVSDVLYGVTGSEIIAYSTNNFVEQFRLNIGEWIPWGSLQFDVGNLVASQDGRYLAVITPTTLRVLHVATGSVTALPTPPPFLPPGGLANISTRALVQTGDDVPIGGFILSGTQPTKVILRAIGPSLTALGVPDALQDPTLELHDQTGAVIASNDDWMDTPQWVEIAMAGLTLMDDRESGIVATLSPGAYTAVLRGKDQTTGVALVEVYDVDPIVDTRLSNISTRALVGTGANVMIAGLIVNGGNDKVLVRGIGPSLMQFNVPDSLQDPALTLHDPNGAVMASNDNWRDPSQVEVRNTGLAPSDDRESAILAILAPGNYTAILRGENLSSGVGLVEVYDFQ